jgi:hypothetical protein
MNVEIFIEAAQFPENECINGIFIAVGGVTDMCFNNVRDGTFPDRSFMQCPPCEGRLGKCVNVQMSVMSSRIPDRKIA